MSFHIGYEKENATFMTKKMRIVVFCDESSVSELLSVLCDHQTLFIVGANRPAALKTAEQLNIPFLVQPPITDRSFKKFCRQLRLFDPDLGVCCSYGMKIPLEILKIPRNSCINFHGGILPAWRGANILNWVLIEGATETGVSAHFMTEGIDEGPVIRTQLVDIQFTDTARTLQKKLAAVTYPLVRDVVLAIANGDSLKTTLQDESKSKKYRRRFPSDGQILWSMTDLEIHNLIRGLVHPWPGAYILLANGEHVVIDSYRSLSEIAKLRHLNQGGTI